MLLQLAKDKKQRNCERMQLTDSRCDLISSENEANRADLHVCISSATQNPAFSSSEYMYYTIHVCPPITYMHALYPRVGAVEKPLPLSRVLMPK